MPERRNPNPHFRTRNSSSPRPVAGLAIVKSREDRCAISPGILRQPLRGCAVARTLAGSAWKDGRPSSRSSCVFHATFRPPASVICPEYLFRGHPTGGLAGILSARGVPHPFVIRTPGSLDSTAKTQLPMDPGLSRAVRTAQPRHRAAPGTPALAETVGGHPASRARTSAV